jgi:hypothetical protein
LSLRRLSFLSSSFLKLRTLRTRIVGVADGRPVVGLAAVAEVGADLAGQRHGGVGADAGDQLLDAGVAVAHVLGRHADEAVPAGLEGGVGEDDAVLDGGDGGRREHAEEQGPGEAAALEAEGLDLRAVDDAGEAVGDRDEEHREQQRGVLEVEREDVLAGGEADEDEAVDAEDELAAGGEGEAEQGQQQVEEEDAASPP